MNLGDSVPERAVKGKSLDTAKAEIKGALVYTGTRVLWRTDWKVELKQRAGHPGSS